MQKKTLAVALASMGTLALVATSTSALACTSDLPRNQLARDFTAIPGIDQLPWDCSTAPCFILAHAKHIPDCVCVTPEGCPCDC
jgi:hypothetical protein